MKKLKFFFLNIFVKKDTNVNFKNTENNVENFNNNFSEILKEETVLEAANKKDKIGEIISIVEKEPKILDNLNIEKLKVIDNYYDKKIEEVNTKINRLKNKFA